MVIAGATGLVDVLVAALAAAVLMLVTRCTTPASARTAIDWTVLVTIGASFGVGSALESTGAAHSIMATWLALAGDNPLVSLAAIYVLTVCATETITNNAAAVLIFPLAVEAAHGLGVDPTPFIIAIMVAASASFATPIGYQTNTMVYGVGGYRFLDFIRVGTPMTLMLGVVALLIIPRVWPF